MQLLLLNASFHLFLNAIFLMPFHGLFFASDKRLLIRQLANNECVHEITTAEATVAPQLNQGE